MDRFTMWLAMNPDVMTAFWIVLWLFVLALGIYLVVSEYRHKHH